VNPTLRVSCHCGAVVLELSRTPRKLTECNCSICRRYGALWAYCSRSRARVVQGRHSLVKYVQEGRKREFWRCRNCGCVTHHQRPNGATIAVNARNMDPQAVAELPIRMLDGAATWKVLSERPQPDLFRSPVQAQRARPARKI
jgi:hypothetical protein